MTHPEPEDDTSALERARKRLYEPANPTVSERPFSKQNADTLPHTWETSDPLDKVIAELPAQGVRNGKRHVRAASIFFAGAFLFFLVSFAVVFYISSIGGNAVSVDKVAIDIQGPTTISGADTVPLSITVTNTNAVAIQNATIEIDFPNNTRRADDVSQPYPRYTENLGTLESGARVTRSVSAILFGGAGQTVSLPVSVSYAASGSNAVFVKKSTYVVLISSTPLSVAVDAVTEAVAGKPITFTLMVRSNASIPIDNVVLNGAFPFGFTVQSSSQPLSNSSFLIGTLAPGVSKTLTLTGMLTGQESELRVFHFTIGTAATAQDQTLAVAYMTQDASVGITAPFISTTIAVNGDTAPSMTLAPGAVQTVKVAYTNTLPTSITNATVSVALSGTAIDYSSIHTTNGFYNSTDHTILFSRDTDPALAVLVSGASGFGTLSFSTFPASALPTSPTITLTTSVSGTRVGQTNVPEQVTASVTKIAKVSTAVVVSTSALHSSGPLVTSGPIPPRSGQATTYTIQWDVRTLGSGIAGASLSATLPNYVSYAGITAGTGNFSYDTGSRTVTWTAGDLPATTNVQGAFQVSFTPSTSQKGSVPLLTSKVSFSGYDRFAALQITGVADPVTTETKNDPGYVPVNATVQ